MERAWESVMDLIGLWWMVILFAKYVISGGEMKAIAKMSIKSSWPTHVNTQNKTDNYVISACFRSQKSADDSLD